MSVPGFDDGRRLLAPAGARIVYVPRLHPPPRVCLERGVLAQVIPPFELAPGLAERTATPGIPEMCPRSRPVQGISDTLIAVLLR